MSSPLDILQHMVHACELSIQGIHLPVSTWSPACKLAHTFHALSDLLDLLQVSLSQRLWAVARTQTMAPLLQPR
jgi:hypothetical protein